MQDLASVTTEDLINELKARSSAIVLGLDPLADKGKFTVLRHGSKLTGSGLLRVLTLESDHDILNDPRDKQDKEIEGMG